MNPGNPSDRNNSETAPGSPALTNQLATDERAAGITSLIVLAVSLAGGVASFFWGPLLVASLANMPSGFSNGARISLSLAWIATVLFGLGALNLVATLRGSSQRFMFAVPAAWWSWIFGGVALALGIVIGRTVFT